MMHAQFLNIDARIFRLLDGKQLGPFSPVQVGEESQRPPPAPFLAFCPFARPTDCCEAANKVKDSGRFTKMKVLFRL